MKILHFLPADGTGGAEIAARSAADASLSVSVAFLERGLSGNTRTGTRFWSMKSLKFALAEVRDTNPEIVVFSLWKCLPALLAIRIMRPSLTVATMLHSSKSVHLPDKIATFLMTRLSHFVLGDSKGSAVRAGPRVRQNVRIVSFLTRVLEQPVVRRAAPNFIFWGRLTEAKNLSAAIRLFHAISKLYPTAKFTMIGPDDGKRQDVEAQIARLNLGVMVDVVGEKDWADISSLARTAAFYLQLSHFEGMAMSVVEAMQLGLVPIVTPVGEIANYCTHLENGIVFSNEAQTVEDVTAVINDPAKYQQLSNAARKTWVGHKDYATDFVDVCAALVKTRQADVSNQ